MSFFHKPQFQVSGRTVLITGGSQGLGLSLARKLAARGANIIIVARDEAKLASALSSIQAAATNPSTQRFLSLSYDLTSPNSAPAILQKVTQWNNSNPPDIVWNCAGYCLPAFFADADIKTLRDQMDTLYWSCAYIAHATLNLWKTPSSDTAKPASPTNTPLPRHLILTSSVVAFFPMAGYAPYSPAKAAMRALADTLTQEVAVYNGAHASSTLPPSQKPPAEIKIHTIFPMGILSPNFEVEEKLKPALTLEFEKGDKPQTPDEVADEAIRGLEAGQGLVAMQLLGKLMKGCGMMGSTRHGVMEVVYNFLGSVLFMFVGWDFVAKARKYGSEKGMATGPARA